MPAWSYLYRRMVPVLLAAGHRVVAPDMPGFGKSDKPTDLVQHTFSRHRTVLLEVVERLDLPRVNLALQDWGGLLGLSLPMAAPDRCRGLLLMNTYLATAEAPLPEGFVQWRAMCRSKPDLSIARLLARGNPHSSPRPSALPTTRRSPPRRIVPPDGRFPRWCPTIPTPTASRSRARPPA